MKMLYKHIPKLRENKDFGNLSRKEIYEVVMLHSAMLNHVIMENRQLREELEIDPDDYPLFPDIPIESDEAIEFLSKNGFTPQSKLFDPKYLWDKLVQLINERVNLFTQLVYLRSRVSFYRRHSIPVLIDDFPDRKDVLDDYLDDYDRDMKAIEDGKILVGMVLITRYGKEWRDHAKYSDIRIFDMTNDKFWEHEFPKFCRLLEHPLIDAMRVCGVEINKPTANLILESLIPIAVDSTRTEDELKESIDDMFLKHVWLLICSSRDFDYVKPTFDRNNPSRVLITSKFNKDMQSLYTKQRRYFREKIREFIKPMNVVYCGDEDQNQEENEGDFEFN